MTRLTLIRNHGAIPERRHDAFLVALLLAVSINVAFFAAQSLAPDLFGMAPTTAVTAETGDQTPFVLVDSSFTEEETPPDMPVHAESAISRRARQTEAMPDLPEDLPFMPEGVDEILDSRIGNPGPDPAAMPSMAASEPVPEPAPEPEPETAPEPVSGQPEVPEAAAMPESPPEPALPDIPEPPLQETVSREPAPPDTVAAPEPIPEPMSESRPPAENMDVAALPPSPNGLFDPVSQRIEELARDEIMAIERRQLPPERQPERQSPPSSIPDALQSRESAKTRESPESAEHRRQDRPRPVIKKIGAAAGTPATSGGTPPRRNTSTSVRLLDEDANMALLRHRYGPYMQKVAEKLQASLIRQVVLAPTSYSRGTVKILFGISPDGTITYQNTVFPLDDLEAERVMSERMLREAAPFDPLTPEMRRDPLFQKLSVTVNLY